MPSTLGALSGFGVGAPLSIAQSDQTDSDETPNAGKGCRQTESPDRSSPFAYSCCQFLSVMSDDSLVNANTEHPDSENCVRMRFVAALRADRYSCHPESDPEQSADDNAYRPMTHFEWRRRSGCRWNLLGIGMR